MMKRLRILIFLSVATLVSVSCGKDSVPVAKRSLLIYMAGNNSLSGEISSCLNQLDEGFLPEKGSRDNVLLLYIRRPSGNPQLVRVERSSNGEMCRSVLFDYPADQNSATAETLSKVLRDAEYLCPAVSRGLVLWSHSTGWLPQGYMNNPIEPGWGESPQIVWSAGKKKPVTSFGEDKIDSRLEIEIQDLAEALPLKYDYILFDSCLMGTVEVAYELMDKCDYLVVSPTEVMSHGFPYYMMLEHLFSDENQESALKAICEEFIDYYKKDYSRNPGGSGGSVALVRTAALPALAAQFKNIAATHRSSMYQLDESTVQRYFRCDYHWFFDLDDLVLQTIGEGPRYTAFKNALSDVVVYKDATEGLMLAKGGYMIRYYSGLSTYIPKEKYEYLNDYYKRLRWNKATGFVL